MLKKYVDINNIKNLLDWGGGEGRFIPTCLLDKEITILDVSNEPLVNAKYLRIAKPPELTEFDYIQICHVLEHVSEPKIFLERIIQYSSYGGYVYVEVPQDRSNNDIEMFKKQPTKMKHFIHEHLNLYSEEAIVALGKALGLEVVCVNSKWIDLGWHNSKIVSGLFKKGKLS